MKLRNKILAFTAPAAVIATITPIMLTSCSKGATWTLDLTNFDHDTYQYKGEQLAGTYTNAEMTTKYYEFAKANPACLAEEIFMEFAGSLEPTNGTVKVWINNIDDAKHTVSCKMEIDATQEIKEVGNINYTVMLEIANLYYVAEWTGTRFKLVPGWKEEEFYAAKDWKVKFGMYYKMGEKEEGELVEANPDSTAEEKQTAWDEVVKNTIYSYYMENCKHGAETETK